MVATIEETGREIPVTGQHDVVVVGGGLGGIAAAMASARAGARTLLPQRNNFVGGVATAGMCCCFSAAGPVPSIDADSGGLGRRSAVPSMSTSGTRNLTYDLPGLSL